MLRPFSHRARVSPELGHRLDHLEGSLSGRLKGIEDSVNRLQKQFTKARPRALFHEEVFQRLAGRVIADGRTYLRDDRLWILYQGIQNAAPLGLPAAEVGSYQGGSALFMAAAFQAVLAREVRLDVVDTFTGHPESTFSEQDTLIRGGKYITSPYQQSGHFTDTTYDEVKHYLAEFSETRVHQGQFIEVKDRLDAPAYGLVHLDVDVYQGTIDALRFFRPRLPLGGVIVLDDYGAAKTPGVRAAVEEFLAESGRYQCWNALTEQLVLVKAATSPVVS